MPIGDGHFAVKRKRRNARRPLAPMAVGSGRRRLVVRSPRISPVDRQMSGARTRPAISDEERREIACRLWTTARPVTCALPLARCTRRDSSPASSRRPQA